MPEVPSAWVPRVAGGMETAETSKAGRCHAIPERPYPNAVIPANAGISVREGAGAG